MKTPYYFSCALLGLAVGLFAISPIAAILAGSVGFLSACAVFYASSSSLKSLTAALSAVFKTPQEAIPAVAAICIGLVIFVICACILAPFNPLVGGLMFGIVLLAMPVVLLFAVIHNYRRIAAENTTPAQDVAV